MSEPTQEKHAACAGCSHQGGHFIIDESAPPTDDGRRRLLFVIGAGAMLAACGPVDGGPCDDGGVHNPNDTGNGTDDTGNIDNDTGNPDTDAGFDDAGNPVDTGVVPPQDSGNPVDTGITPPPVDSGPPDTGVVACTPLSETLGPLTNYPLNSYHLLTGADGGNGIIVGHDSGGLYCMTAICTHQGCQVNAPNASTGAIRCGCHGATYNANGTNLTVAPRPLVHYQLVVCAGQVSCNTSMTVSATTRTPAA